MTKKFKKSNVNETYKGMIPLEFDEGGSGEESTVEIPTTIHLIPIGEWAHDAYGPIIIKNSDIREFVQNFNAGVRKGVFITAGHEGFEELPAVGWIQSVESRDDGLWGTVEWNELGKETLSDKQYKFFSPELCRDYEDPQTHDLYRNVLTGGALTKSPYFKELNAIVFSDKSITNNFNNQAMYTLEELLAMDIASLDDAQKAFIKEHASELTDEQKVTYADIIKDEAPAETEEEKAAREEKEQGDANEAAGLNRDGSTKEEPKADDAAADGAENVKIEASEKGGMITMTKEMFSHLETMANKGAQAFAALEKAELDTMTAKLTFSESNKDGKFLPKSTDALRTFMKGLNKDQRQAFAELMKSVPSTGIFSEKGAETTVEVGSFNEVETLVNAKMKANDKLSYSDALKQVMSENPGLEQRYDEGLPASKAKTA